MNRLRRHLRTDASLGTTGVPPPPPWSLWRRYAETGDRLAYERVYFARRGRLAALAAVALFDRGGAAVRDALADLLWSVCDEYTWALPAHAHLVADPRDLPRCVDLFAAETAHTLSEVVTGLGDRLPKPVIDRVRAEVRRRVLDPLFADPRPWSWESAANNWSAVCGGAAGLAALALWSDADPRLAPALDRCRAAMATYRSGLGAAGGCAEGVDYWVYGFGYYCYFAEALRERTGVDLLGEVPAGAAAFPAAVELAGGRYVSFSDASEAPVLPSGLLSRLHQRLGAPLPARVAVPGFGDDHCHRWGHLSRTLAWTDPALLRQAPVAPGGAWLPDLAWLVDRREIGGLPVAFAAKGGHNDEPHNHLDLGQFILAAGGEQLLADLGAGEYTAGYFGPGRYGHLHPSAAGHSVPVVDGRGQRPGRDAAAVVLNVDRRDGGARLALDLSAAYGVPVRRELRWHAPVLALTDHLPTAAFVDELFISRIPPVVAGTTVAFPGHAGVAVIHVDRTRCSPSVERIETRDHHGAPDAVYRLRLSGPADRRVAFTIELAARAQLR